MLAQVLQIRRLFDQPIHLRENVQLFVRFEIPARQLLFDPTEYLQCTRILYLLSLSLVGNRCDGRAMATTDERRHMFAIGIPDD
jgi:hypothetical protein